MTPYQFTIALDGIARYPLVYDYDKLQNGKLIYYCSNYYQMEPTFYHIHTRTTMAITTAHLCKLHKITESNNDNTLNHNIIYHHLQIIAHSSLILHDQTLYLFKDNTIHPLTLRGVTTSAPPHSLKLFFNPHGSLSYLQYDYTGSTATPQRFVITTTLPSTRAMSH